MVVLEKRVGLKDIQEKLWFKYVYFVVRFTKEKKILSYWNFYWRETFWQSINKRTIFRINRLINLEDNLKDLLERDLDRGFHWLPSEKNIKHWNYQTIWIRPAVVVCANRTEIKLLERYIYKCSEMIKIWKMNL